MRIGVIGYGSIGRALQARLDVLEGATISAVLTRRPPEDAPRDLCVVTDLEALLAGAPDIVVECAGHAAVRDHGAAILKAGVPLMLASLGALADPALEAEIRAAARTPGARLLLPSGAIGGLDLLRAVALETRPDVHYHGIKPPAAWVGTLAEEQVDLSALTGPSTIFEGTGRAAARAFPRNANVVAALALAGAGFDTLRVTLVADPEARGNTHRYRVRAPFCRYEMTIEGASSAGNARTSQTTVLGLLDELRRFSETRGVAPCDGQSRP